MLMIGQRFGKLTATETIKRHWKIRNLIRCRCDCGNDVLVLEPNLKRGNSRSCGCSRHGKTDLPFVGASRLPEYQVWKLMRIRCSDPKDRAFANYGGRGIRVCDDWQHSFAAFYRDMGPRPADGYTLDRIDVNGDYEPSNCRWATMKEQQSNKRSNHVVLVDGNRMTLKQAAAHYGISYANLSYRLNSGWPFEKAISKSLFDSKGRPIH